MLYVLQLKIQNDLQFVQTAIRAAMSDQRLDRLSALLNGLAPQVKLALVTVRRIDGRPVTDEPPFLQLFLLTGGTVKLSLRGKTTVVPSPSLIALRSDQSFMLTSIPKPGRGRLICARTRLVGPVAALFLDEFEHPRIISLTHDEPALRMAVTMIEAELDAPRCGQPALLDRAGDILFIGLLRYLVAHPATFGNGLFHGLADHRIARALVAMHQRPGFAWSLERLAEEAGMSRTAFAATFRDVVKRTPGKYLTLIRLAIAQRTVELGKGLKVAARTSGYSNESALSRALSKARDEQAKR